MHDQGRRRFRFILLILILAIAIFIGFRPDSTEKKNAAPSIAAANATRQRATSAATVDAKPATAAPSIATDNGSASLRSAPEFAPTRIDVRVPVSARAGEAFQATVDIDASRSIRTLEFTVRFDRRILQLVGSPAGTFVQQSALPADFGAQEPSDGVVLVHFYVENGLAVAGAGSVVILEFQALKAGTSPIRVDDITLAETGRDGTSTMPSLANSSIAVE